MNTTVGQLLLNEALPPDLRDYGRVYDKNSVREVFRQVAEKYPDQYKDILHRMYQLGGLSDRLSGASLSIKALRPPPEVRVKLQRLRESVRDVYETDGLDAKQKEERVKAMVMKAAPELEQDLYDAAVRDENPFAIQVLSGSRGKKGDLRSLLLGDLLVSDHRDRIIPVPILNSYAKGLTPAETWAAAYGARKGAVFTKLMTQKAGFFGKRLVRAAHQQVVTENDCGTTRGIEVDADDTDNEGAVLAGPAGGFDAGRLIDGRVMKQLKRKGGRISVRSPLTCQAEHGVCAKCVGVRETGTFPEIGDNVGVAAATSLTEQMSQSSLSTKHGGGRAEADSGPKGYELADALVDAPSSFQHAAAVASEDGQVDRVVEAPQGGYDVVVGGVAHHVRPGLNVKVKPGDTVEAGDLLSDGIPNPRDLVQYRGVGDARRQFVDLFRKAYLSAGMKANRRNIELLTRGLLNHVKVTDLDGPGGSMPDDILEYQNLERGYTPREGTRRIGLAAAKGMYLEKPVAHYTIGTRVGRRVMDTLKRSGVSEIDVHEDPPPFEPHMVRAMETLTHSPDWQIRLGGSYLEKGLLDATHRGLGSSRGTSFIPAAAQGVGFGDKLKTEGTY